LIGSQPSEISNFSRADLGHEQSIGN